MLNIRTLNQQFEMVNPAYFWNDKLDTLIIHNYQNFFAIFGDLWKICSVVCGRFVR